MNSAVWSCPDTETGVQTSIGIEPGNLVAVRAIHGGEIATDEHLAIGLHNERMDFAIVRVVLCYGGIETGVETSVRIEPDNGGRVGAIPGITGFQELAAGKHLAIAL